MEPTAGVQHPECDVVMKGGITSGIVYPRAIAKLAGHYRLRALGGASAGAIAASAAAAAEYGRASGGFERLAALPDELASPVAGGREGDTRLFGLFQPDASTRELFALLVAGLMPEKPRWGLAAWRWLLAAVRSFPATALLALAVVAAAFTLLFARTDYIAAEACHRAGLRAIDLRLMTTALSHGRPYSFPLENESFCFDEAEMRRLFPAIVVDALIADSPGRIDDGVLAGRYRLPAMQDLPVLVPLRMSLAFPLLLSAVPLWRQRRDPDPARRGAWLSVAERVWFSDGGICSNFPIHYFDALVPARPTFGINLVDASFIPRDPVDPDDYVWMPAHNGSGATTRVIEVERGGRRGLGGFLGAIIETMQGWSDSTQLAIPGYRDRIVAVRLESTEGGLNLRMGAPLIRRIAVRGERAGQLLLDHYAQADPPPGTVTGWRNHRWVRYRVAMRVLGEALADLRAAEAESAGTDAALQPMHANPPSYDFKSERQREAALAAYRDLLALAERHAAMRDELGYPPFDHDPKDGPRPRPELRIRPPL